MGKPDTKTDVAKAAIAAMEAGSTNGRGEAAFAPQLESFREFFLRKTGVAFPGRPGESLNTAFLRMATTTADFCDELTQRLTEGAPTADPAAGITLDPFAFQRLPEANDAK